MQKAFYTGLLFIALGIQSAGQATGRVAAVPDTFYNIRNEYNKQLQNHPDIKMTGNLQSNYLAEQKSIVYCRMGQRKLLLDVFSSKQNNKDSRTAILLIHGGGWKSGDRSMHYPLAQRLAILGYVCITPEYRLSAEALYPAAVYDIKAAIRWVRRNAKKYNIDTARIVVAGHSAGGELAAFMGATNGLSSFDGNNHNAQYSGNVNAVIDMDGILAFIHPESGEGDDSKKLSAATQWLGYSKTQKPELWKEASPLTYAGAVAAPVLFINSGVTRMHAGREDFIAVLNKYNIYSAVKTFKGSPHSFVFFNPWFDSTLIEIDKFCKKIFPQQKNLPAAELTVAQDGTGIFSTVQAAFDAIPLNNTKKIKISIKPGTYREKLFLDSTKNFVSLTGSDKMETILTWDDHTGKISPSGDTINTRTSWSCKIKADNFSANNITFQNDAGFTAGQAVALESDGDRAVFIDCRFIGNQDVLFLNNEKSRQWFQTCYIEGTTDFIFGAASAWFQKCEIFSKKNSHITAASTPAFNKMGFVFDSCVLKADTSLHNVSLGRPWRPYAHVVYMNCYIGSHIKPDGWSNWNNTENYKTARYAEYKNFGPSADPAKRVSWSRQLSDEEAREYSLKNFMQSWYPHK